MICVRRARRIRSGNDATYPPAERVCGTIRPCAYQNILGRLLAPAGLPTVSVKTYIELLR